MVAAGVLAVAGAAAHDTSLHVPGTALRFGTSLLEVQHVVRMQAAPTVTLRPPTPSPPGVIAWQTGLRFFGLAGAATLEFVDGGLARATVIVNHPSPHDIDYVEDDLARQGLHRRCDQRSGLDRRCEWTGRVRVQMTTSATSLEARLESLAKPPGPAPGPGAGAPRGGAVAAALPETLALSLSPPAGAPGASDTSAALPWPMVLDSCHAVRPEIARQSGVFGRVLVEVTVESSGRVIAARVTRGVPMLDEAALACASRTRFAPCTWRGRAHPFRVTLPILFTL